MDITIGKTVSYVVGTGLIFFGVLMTVLNALGLVSVLAGVVLFPIVRRQLERQADLQLSRRVTAAIALIGVVALFGSVIMAGMNAGDPGSATAGSQQAGAAVATATMTATPTATTTPAPTTTATSTATPTATATRTATSTPTPEPLPDIEIRIRYAGEWQGALSITEDGTSSTRSIEGSGDRTIDISNTPIIVSVNAQKQDRGSGELTVQIVRDGEVVAEARTTAEFGVAQTSQSFF